MQRGKSGRCSCCAAPAKAKRFLLSMEPYVLVACACICACVSRGLRAGYLHLVTRTVHGEQPCAVCSRHTAAWFHPRRPVMQKRGSQSSEEQARLSRLKGAVLCRAVVLLHVHHAWHVLLQRKRWLRPLMLNATQTYARRCVAWGAALLWGVAHAEYAVCRQPRKRWIPCSMP